MKIDYWNGSKVHYYHKIKCRKVQRMAMLVIMVTRILIILDADTKS